LDFRCRIVVYFIAKDGEVVADALEFEVSGTLTNFVEIFTSRFFIDCCNKNSETQFQLMMI